MSSPVLSCPERSELEQRIAECLAYLHPNAGDANAAAPAAARVNGVRVHSLQAEQAARTARLQILRDCLELHRSLHGC